MEAGIDSHLWSRSPTVPQISEEQLTRWAESCLRMNHLGTLIQRELKASKENARAGELGNFLTSFLSMGHESLLAMLNQRNEFSN
jgi:hypothetical protein